ncbi:MAG: hypothetical protein CMM46_13900 [Rhodospirillaceae bacterium]|nr:hypothetical protein [Rhodospirillaceae bacterium]|tara:strand:- start:19658 stop:20503 length:846 start_codon:yes stop_codon:yes gene_type:complete
MTNKGHCLCGVVTWEFDTEPFYAFNCHCTMCQKAHGTAFGTYWFFKADQIRITGGDDLIVGYRSSDVLVRTSCDVCGSVVPYPSDDASIWIAPAGCHDDGRGSDYDIFIADNAPWHDLTGHLPRCDAYPEESGIPSVSFDPPGEPVEGVVRGSCLCGTVRYHVTKPMTVAHYCHCSRCRHGRAAAHASNGFTSLDGVTFLQGEDNLREYKVPDATFFTQVFCKTCSSPMPRLDEGRGVAIVPLGGLDDDPGIKPVDHIFVDSMAGWHEITGDLPCFPEGPG